MKYIKFDKDNFKFTHNEISQNQEFLNLLNKDYIPNGTKSGYLLFYKRHKLDKVLKKAGFLNNKGVYYDIVKKSNKKNGKLIFLFTSVPAVADISNPNIINRTVVKNYNSLPLNIGDDVTIIRIFDINNVIGSFFLNTPNFPNYENAIKDTLDKLIKEYDAKLDKTIFMSTSKGATAALYYGSMYKSNIIANDPILDLKQYIEKRRNLVYFDKAVEVDLVNAINSKIATNNPQVYVYCTPKCEWTYNNIIRLKNVYLYELDHIDITEHADIASATTRKIYGMINKIMLDI